MKKRAWLILGIGLMIGADDAKKELDRFEGDWKFVSVEVGGMKMDIAIFKNSLLSCHGDKFTFKEGDMLTHGTFKVDPTKKPKTIDVIFNDGPQKGSTMLGIYKLEGDVYKVCFDTDGKTRPKEFASKEGTRSVYEILQREKK
jgi:uncharacterized protein (TIGR03067 family)